MQRSAILASLAVHAGLVCLVSWLWSSTGGGVGPGQPGADASFLADAAEGAFLATAAPDALLEPVSQPPFPEPALSLPEASAFFSTPSINATAAMPARFFVSIAAPRAIPVAVGNAFSSKAEPVNHRVRAGSRGKAGAQRPGEAGGGGSGPGVGGDNAGYAPPQFRIRYKPPYPEEARAHRLEGIVLLLVSIDASGRVTSAIVRLSCGHAVLDRTALASVRAWRFDPARQNGAAIAARVEIPVRFVFEAGVRRRG